MSDLRERLRAFRKGIETEAADEIDRLEVEVADLFAKLADATADADAICASYAKENQRLSDEIASLRAQVDALNGDIHQIGQERDDIQAQLDMVCAMQRDSSARQNAAISRAEAAEAQLAIARKAAIEECAKHLEQCGFRYSQGFDVPDILRRLALSDEQRGES